MLVLDLDSAARAHLRRALEEHDRWCRANGRRFPEALAAVISAVHSGQERSFPDPSDGMADDDDVPPAQPLLLTLDEAGQRLSLSERTLRRLAEAGELRTVRIGHAVRVHHADLVAFAEGLREGTARCSARTGAA